MTTLDSVLAVALTLRGARVDVLLCNEVLPACQSCLLGTLKDEWVVNEFIPYGPRRELCRSCHGPADAMFRALGVKVLHYGDFLAAGEEDEAWRLARTLTRDEIFDYTSDGFPIGEHARAGAIRFFARTSLEREPHGDDVLRRFFAAALITRASIERLLTVQPYAAASFNHGIYVPQGIVGAVARRCGIRVVNWIQSYRRNSFIFSHGDTYHHTLMTEPVSTWADLDWDDERETELMTYLKSRWTGSQDWISFSRAAETEPEAIARATGIDWRKPSIGLLTNVMWDAQLHYPQNAFADMWEWLAATIAYFATRPDLQLIIRVHPAELRGHIQSRQPIADEIRNEIGQLPPNIFLIPPESPVSTYAVMAQCDSVLIYGTKTGVELTSMGIPVIVAGEAWIRNKGITTDVRSPEHYRAILDGLPCGRRLDADTIRRAKKYAYHFFFRRMIPLSVIRPVTGDPKRWSPYEVHVSGLRDLEPGRDAGLDTMCDGILHGTDFIYRTQPSKTTKTKTEAVAC
ncbi:MAG: capsule biosynthesis protein [Acidobacteria bacterium]|nr:capsule biosynthesis protein [Acidobacteriota bacterium]